MFLRLGLVAMLATGMLAAQGKKGGSRSSSNDMGDMPRVVRVTRFETIADKLKLSKEQREEATTFFDAAQEAAGPLNDRIANGRNQITSAMIQGQNSGESYNKLLAAYTEVLTQMAQVEATAYAKLYAVLKPNQQAKAAQVFEEQFAGLFAGRDYKRIR